MGIGMRLRASQSQSLRLRHVQTLAHKLRITLTQALQLLQQLQLGLRLTQEQTLELVAEILQATEQYSVAALAPVILRERGIGGAELVRDIVRYISRRLPEDSPTRHTLHDLSLALRLELEERRHRARPVIALRLMLRAPDFFGGRGGEPEDLYDLLNTVDQLDELGRIRWVLAGGWAVELLTGVAREHHDIDALILSRRLERVDTDTREPGDYFSVLSCTPRFVREDCVEIVEWEYRGSRLPVIVLRPEFLFCSKFVRAPRAKDWVDVQTLVKHFAHEWDLSLMARIMRRNSCDFKKELQRRLLKILASRNADEILASLGTFWS